MTLSSEDMFASAYVVANGMLMLEKPITAEALDRAVKAVGDMPPFAEIDLHRLRKALESENNVHVSGYSVIDDLDFEAWVKSKRDGRKFPFWDRYLTFLDRKKRIPREVREQLDKLTDDILDRLRDPDTKGHWDRRGLVVGDVQSGKTSNYTGLICKAVDAGYPLIIVLAGVHNSLRSQTQIRLDEGFLGFDTRLNLVHMPGNQRIGAGALPGAPFLVAHSLTSRAETGDFRRGVAEGTKVIPGGKDPVILVVKKNVSVLKNLLAWVTSVRADDDENTPGGKLIRDVPLLLVDDEADFGSLNTNEYRDEDGFIIPDNDPTETNRLIRLLLSAFEKSAYVGYTATPFANVFVHHEGFSKKAGEDLFPRSFIINIPAPSNYIGAEKVFGLKKPDDEGRTLPIVRSVRDAAALFPPKHKKEHPVTGLPASLHEALLAFMLSCAARRARGDIEVHNSMLVHVTRFTLVQDQVAQRIEDEVVDIRRQLEFPGAGGDALTRLEDLWGREFEDKQDQIAALLSDHDLPRVTWSEVEAQLFEAVKAIEVRRINGSAKDALDYDDHPKGLTVIAVGGDKLSRGLTLEGLSVSYFIRTSRMYDTLMQMGRWFGYRPRYADLCRLYTDPELVKWYRHIATASAELREEFEVMAAQGADPYTFGHRVQTHPDGMLITAANKMRASSTVRAGFSGTISETVAFDVDQTEWNFRRFAEFLAALPKTSESAGRFAWDAVSGKSVVGLLRTVRTSADSWKANAGALSDYIAERVANGCLKDWKVVLVASGRTKEPFDIEGYMGRQTERTPSSDPDSAKFTIGRLVSPADELLDLDNTQQGRALDLTIEAWKRKKAPKDPQPKAPSGASLRMVRDRTRGLLLIYPIYQGVGKLPLMGFAISFPFDKDGPLIEYAENSVKQLEREFE